MKYIKTGTSPLTMDAEQQEEKAARRRSVFIQIVVGLVSNLGVLAPGMTLGFSAVALPQMTAEGSVPHISNDEASWIASLASIAPPFGCLMSGALMDRFGRKMSLLALNVPCLLGWVLLACAPSTTAFLPMVYSGRFFTGIATGMASTSATVLLAELADSSLRGMLVTWTSVAISLGICIVYILGSCLQDNWRLVATICAIFPVVAAIVGAILLPESPVWLLSNDRPKEAESSLRRARGIRKQDDTPSHVQEELEIISTKISHQNAHQNQSSWVTDFRKTVLCPETIKPLFIMNTFFFFQQFSGTFVIIVYAVDVVKEAGVYLDSYLTAILIGATRVLVTIIVGYVSNRFGRRAPAIVSGAGMTLCMGTLATYLCLIKPGVNKIPTIGWIPVTALLLYIVTSTIGFLTLPWAMIGEIFPAKVRGLASGFTTCMAYIFSFIIIKLYPNMLNVLGRDGLFFFYGGVALLGTVFVIIFLPETKGKSLQEIEDYFRGKKIKMEKRENTSSDKAEEEMLQRT